MPYKKKNPVTTTNSAREAGGKGENEACFNSGMQIPSSNMYGGRHEGSKRKETALLQTNSFQK